MFDIGWSEMMVILLVALVVIGPKDLPRVARTVGRWVGKGRAMAREFQKALEDMAKEAELDTVKKEIEKASRTDFGKAIEKSIDPGGELKTAFDPSARPAAKPASAAPPSAPADPATTGGEVEGAAAEVAGPPPAPAAPERADGQADPRHPATAEPR